MTIYSYLKQLSTTAIAEVVRLTHKDAVGLRTEKNNAFSGKRVEWHVVNSETQEVLSVTAFDERAAWQSALEWICREKWPNG